MSTCLKQMLGCSVQPCVGIWRPWESVHFMRLILRRIPVAEICYQEISSAFYCAMVSKKWHYTEGFKKSLPEADAHLHLPVPVLPVLVSLSSAPLWEYDVLNVPKGANCEEKQSCISCERENPHEIPLQWRPWSKSVLECHYSVWEPVILLTQ